ncbi:hypothetical protein SAMN04488056_106140 [Cohaesibacter marisflavi]|uniref:Uncharacterized protein n=1 Tax=Cohaesibacter marisflavi TaxID=655353 RepID=A0A1I5HBA4_9HYPH|nr:hypothetical protein [Cohaesibacter marisflavi]SFO45572.1 hypothetical protein SAMN04488056_106140 [Cohaesibacter marisflavi]
MPDKRAKLVPSKQAPTHCNAMCESVHPHPRLFLSKQLAKELTRMGEVCAGVVFGDDVTLVNMSAGGVIYGIFLSNEEELEAFLDEQARLHVEGGV